MECLTASPLFCWPYSPIPRFYSSHLRIGLSLCKANNISFNVTAQHMNRIRGGSIELRLAFTAFPQFRVDLCNNEILFLEQLTTLGGQFLLNWKAVRSKCKPHSPRASTRSSKWFRAIELYFTSLSTTGLHMILS